MSELGDRLHEIALEIRESMEPEEKESTEIVVPSFALGIKVQDFDIFTGITEGRIKLRTSDPEVGFTLHNDWFYENLDARYVDEPAHMHRADFKPEALEDIAEQCSLLNPATGELIRDVQGFDVSAQTYRAGSGHTMSWGGSSMVGNVVKLTRPCLERFGDYNQKQVDYCFINTDDNERIRVSGSEHFERVPRVGDQLVAVDVSGDYFNKYHLLRPDPTRQGEFKGVWYKPSEKDQEKPFLIGAYGFPVERVRLIPVSIKRYSDFEKALPS